MGYERNDRGYGRDRYGQSRSSYGSGDNNRFSGHDDRQRDYGRQSQGNEDDRGFFDRAGDEVRSWFGDDDAERRRREDERRDEQDYRSRQRSEGRSSYESRGSYQDRGSYGTPNYGARSGGAYASGGGYSAGDYGAGFGAGATSSFGVGAGNDRSSWGQDPNYRSWRDRQLESFDRDYEDYQREHQSKFDTQFHSWRQGRQTQRDSLQRVNEHQEVVGSDGQHVGTVDKVRGDRIILTKNDQDAGGHHHSIPSSWIENVDEKVTISKTADQAKAHWRDEERNSAFGGGSNRGDDQGARNLNRSFSGTY